MHFGCSHCCESGSAVSKLNSVNNGILRDAVFFAYDLVSALCGYLASKKEQCQSH